MERLPWKDRDLAGAGLLAFVRLQLRRLSRGLEPRPQASPRAAFALDRLRHWRRVRAYGAWLTRNPEPGDPRPA